MDLSIRKVTTLRELRAFIRFPNTLYRDHPYWVPPLFADDYQTLRRDKNPAFDDCEARYWLAYRGREIVGRIAAIHNHKHVEKWQQPYLRFGWVDFVDDPAVSAALFEQVEAWAGEKGLSAVHGPLGFTDLDREGMLVEGFEELGTLATIYNYPYYPVHLERLGYHKDVDWVEYEINAPPGPNATIARIADLAARRCKLHLLRLRNKKELLRPRVEKGLPSYAHELFDVLNDEYEHLYGVIPLSGRQIDYYIKLYFNLISLPFVPIVVDENDRLVAFGITMPSFSRALQKSGGRLFPFGFIHLLRALRKGDRGDLYLVAVRSEYQGKGVTAILMNEITQVFARRGIVKAESNPELETNQNVQSQWKYYDTRQHKRRRCFIKHLV
ncbi:MAG: GNAT family N-acetyltransferase [Anaerolineae bacterium]|nr:GNAT family N-acetyltransferase [Anaerolineae bacterium]